MILDKRRAHLLSVIQQSSKPIHAKQLVEKLGISQRTVYYDLQQINDWLTSQKLEPIENIHGQGYWLSDASKAKINLKGYQVAEEQLYQFSDNERKLLIIVKLLTEESNLTMKSFISVTQMSRGTIVKDLQKVKEQLEEHKLQLEYSRSDGYHVTGAEEDKRKLLSNLLSTIMLNKEWVTIRTKIYNMLGQIPTSEEDSKIPDREKITQLIVKTENELFLTFTDEMVEMLALELRIIVKRVVAKQYVEIDAEEKMALEETQHYQAAEILIQRLSVLFTIEIPENEVSFLTMNLLGLKVHRDNFSQDSEREKTGLQQVIQRMIADFQTYACVIFDDRKGLEVNLMAHIKPMYYRLKYNVKTLNHLVPNIKKNYPEIFHFTKRVMIHMEYYVGRSVPEEEVAYIALHFGGWLRRENKQVDYKFRAIIVCQNGIGTSNMLKTQLESLVAGLEVVTIQSLREYHSNVMDADVIFSTSRIKENEIPIIHVPAILSNTDKQQILQKVNELFRQEYEEKSEVDKMLSIIGNYATVHDPKGLKHALQNMGNEDITHIKELKKPMLKELLTEKTIQLEERVSNWEEAIKLAAQPLLAEQVIKEGYIEAMIDNVKDLGPYIVIAPNIALPHARPETGVERVGMSLLRLTEPVYFSDKEKHRAQLIIVLAATDNQSHLKALSQLTEMLSNEENVQHLIDSKNKQDVLALINQ
ncbi:BglG family transcription antiterminator [Virgibacillus flavescens]|uniref:BglG family transcription antiterminator n=1 Tax=Virgibacillus flavescens TaxID=1611422 RepID=UPI003D347BC2